MNEAQQSVDIQLRGLMAQLTNKPPGSVHVSFAPMGLLQFKAALDAGKLPAVKAFAVEHDWNFYKTGFIFTDIEVTA